MGRGRARGLPEARVEAVVRGMTLRRTTLFVPGAAP